MNLAGMSSDELNALMDAAKAELEARRQLAELRAIAYRHVNGGGGAARVLEETAAGVGLPGEALVAGAEVSLPERVDREPWTPPQGAHDAYRLGAEVTHEGKVWRNITPINTWEPGVSGWREVVVDEDGEPTDEPAEWVRPSGTHDAYGLGDRVTFEGQVYESVHEGANTWSPSEYPAAWRLIEQEN